jgi:hypothetical protein
METTTFFPDWRELVTFAAPRPEPTLLRDEDGFRVLLAGLEPSAAGVTAGAGETIGESVERAGKGVELHDIFLDGFRATAALVDLGLPGRARSNGLLPRSGASGRSRSAHRTATNSVVRPLPRPDDDR